MLKIFDDKAAAPAGLSAVDSAFLNALYNTSAKSRLQRSEIETRVQSAYRATPKDQPG